MVALVGERLTGGLTLGDDNVLNRGPGPLGR
jgi:hypothetical protein